jgi:hypothetical protein
MANTATVALAWQQLLDTVKSEAERATTSPPQPSVRWIEGGRLALLGTWQVEASFMNREGSYQIHFDRFNWQAGSTNFVLPPGAKAVRGETWQVQFVEGRTQAFWRLNAQDLSPERLARKAIEYLYQHYEKTKLASVA